MLNENDPDHINNLELTIRSTNVLKEAKIVSIKELSKLDDNTLLKMPNVGKKCLKEIKDAVSYYKKKNCTTDEQSELDELKEFLENAINMAVRNCLLAHKDYIREMQDHAVEIFTSRINNLALNPYNEIRTLILEQGRILDGMKLINKPNGMIDVITKKIPGFDVFVNKLYEKLLE